MEELNLRFFGVNKYNKLLPILLITFYDVNFEQFTAKKFEKLYKFRIRDGSTQQNDKIINSHNLS